MKKLKLIDFYLIGLIASAVSAVILRTYALFFDLDRSTMHFSGSISATIANTIVILATLAFGSYFFIKKEECDFLEKTDNAASFIPSGIVSVALVFMGVSLIKSMNTHYTPMLQPISLWAAILAFLSVGSFFVSILIEERNNLYKSAFSICIVVFLALYACYLYFNREIHPTNSPSKVVDQMAYLFAAAFFLYESRITLGRAKWRGYVTFGLIASLLCFYSAIPSLILYIVNGELISDSLAESAVTLAMAIFITSKVFQTKRLTPDTECEVARSITALHEMRKDEIEQLRKSSHARVINNMEETDDGGDMANYTFDIPYVETRSEFASDETTPE
jgi:hypothetical protein